jgi:hypothetical protein
MLQAHERTEMFGTKIKTALIQNENTYYLVELHTEIQDATTGTKQIEHEQHENFQMKFHYIQYTYS